MVNINTGTGLGTGTGTGTETAIGSGSSLYERIYLLCTQPTNYSGNSNNNEPSQAQSSRYSELGVETEVDGNVPSSSSSINGRHPRPGPLGGEGGEEGVGESSSPRDGIVSEVCSAIYGWTAAATATQGEQGLHKQ